MQLISRKELLEKFELQQNQMTQIKVEGNFSIEMNFSKFSYNIEEDNLKISDMMSNNFIVFSTFFYIKSSSFALSCKKTTQFSLNIASKQSGFPLLDELVLQEYYGYQHVSLPTHL